VPAIAPIHEHPSARPRRKGELTAERILDAAEDLFAERGYAGTTLRDVSAAVGLRTPSLYNHFPSKEALYAAVLERGIGPLLATLSEAVVMGEGDLQHDPSRLVGQLMAQLAQRPKLPRLIQHETLAGGEHLSPMLREWIRPVFARADQMVAAAPAASSWERDQLPLLVIAMYNVMVGYFTIAPLYAELNGEDLLTREMFERQTRLFSQLVTTLFGPPAASGDRRDARNRNTRDSGAGSGRP
jgi:AcrR family transcriptional regulator